MKIQTNAGEVELTAEMVCRGMVFEGHRFLTTNGLFTCGHKDAWGAWQDQRTTSVTCPEDTADRLLGCDPTIATRADCERYGVHGDAAAHGFARIPSGGALDLRNAENVRKGMLFRTGGRDVTAACDGQFALDDDARHVVFIGCHPALARREDCERFGIPERCEQFGVAPLDAAAHGFARLRDGGAVDLRRTENVRGGMVFGTEGGRRLLTAPWAGGETQNIWRTSHGGTFRLDGTGDARFVGLDDRCARPEDVERLCCGEAGPAESGEMDPRCTLAIGEHDTHEDLATGVKWSASGPAIAKAFTYPPYMPDASIKVDGTGKSTTGDKQRAGSGVDAAKAHIRAHLDFAKGHFFTGSPSAIRRVLAACDLRGDIHRLAPGSYRVTLEGADAVLCDAVQRWLSDNCQADVMHEVVSTSPKPSTGSAYLQEIPEPTKRSDSCDFGEPSCSNCGSRSRHCCEPIAAAFCAFVAGLKQWAASPEGKRAAQERALVALVNAVPEGLDPIGWRAAVLACHESYARLKNDAPHPEEWGVLAAVRGCPTGREGTWKRAAEDADAAAAAYYHAITPAAPVPRVRATWKTRGPVLAVDDGRDE